MKYTKSKQWNQLMPVKDCIMEEISDGRSFNMIRKERRAIIVNGHCDISGQLNSPAFKYGRMIINIKSVGGSFFCSSNELTSLDNLPKFVGKSYSIHDNKIGSLEGMPEKIDGILNCYKNKLTSLKGCPEIVEHLNCSYNNIFTLDHLPICETLNISNNKLTSLIGIHKSKAKQIALGNNKIEEGGIGLLLIPNITSVVNTDQIEDNNLSIIWTHLKKYMNKNESRQIEKTDFEIALDIIIKYLPQGKLALLKCADELQQAGLERFAKL